MKIQADHLCAALRKRQRVLAEMTLQMQHAQPCDRAKLAFFDRIQRAPPGAQQAQVVSLEVRFDPLIPIGAIGLAPVSCSHPIVPRAERRSAWAS